MSLLNHGNAKTRKGEKNGFLTIGLHLAPSNLSGFNVCKHASAGCAAACLNTAGRGAMSSVQKARIAKTLKFFADSKAFMDQVSKEIHAACSKARRKGLLAVARLNLTSDLPFENIKNSEGETIFQRHSGIQFYDYTADLDRMMAFLNGEMPKNYHLTFSRKENTPDTVCQSVLASGGNVAVVFGGMPFDKLPAKWLGFPVVNGDETDLRFLDGKGVVVGLLAKGKAKKDTSGFVVRGDA